MAYRLTNLGRKKAISGESTPVLILCTECGDRWPIASFRVLEPVERMSLYCERCRREKPELEGRLGIPQPESVAKRPTQAYRRLFNSLNKIRRGMEVENLASGNYDALKIMKLPDRVAAIVGKTYAVAGDDFKLADDQALMRIRDLLDAIDPTLIDRNKNKRLSRT